LPSAAAGSAGGSGAFCGAAAGYSTLHGLAEQPELQAEPQLSQLATVAVQQLLLIEVQPEPQGAAQLPQPLPQASPQPEPHGAAQLPQPLPQASPQPEPHGAAQLPQLPQPEPHGAAHDGPHGAAQVTGQQWA
jgi:hypothetical protein